MAVKGAALAWFAHQGATGTILTMTRHPTCCSPLKHHWPLPRPVPGAVLVSCTFDPARLAADDFQRAGIEQSASLQRSVAKRQAEYLAGRVCARAALHALDGRDYVPATHEDRSPIWPAGRAHGPATGASSSAATVALPIPAAWIPRSCRAEWAQGWILARRCRPKLNWRLAAWPKSYFCWARVRRRRRPGS